MEDLILFDDSHARIFLVAFQTFLTNQLDEMIPQTSARNTSDFIETSKQHKTKERNASEDSTSQVTKHFDRCVLSHMVGLKKEPKNNVE